MFGTPGVRFGTVLVLGGAAVEAVVGGVWVAVGGAEFPVVLTGSLCEAALAGSGIKAGWLLLATVLAWKEAGND